MQVLVGVLLSIVGVSFSFGLSDFPAFATSVKVCAVFVPLCTALSGSFSIVFVIENRRLMMFGMIVVRPIIQAFLELFLYSFHINFAAPETNYPTTVAIVVSHVLVAVWVVWFNYGKSALGVTNLEEFPDLNFWDWDFKKMFYCLKLLPATVNGFNQALFYFAVMLAQQNVEKTFSDESAKLAMFYQLFTFMVFG